MAITGVLNAFEASVAAPRGDATAPTVDTVDITADALNAGDVASFGGTVAVAGIIGTLAATEAADIASFSGDAVQPPVVIGGGGSYYPPLRPSPITGYGFGVLPELAGEAHGGVIAAGIGAAMRRNPAGEAAGAVGARGRSQGQLQLRAAASGARCSKGAAVAGLDLGAGGSGAIIARGSAGAVVIGNLEAVAIGRQDDEEAVIVWLLAA
jgi:hypothetical protein